MHVLFCNYADKPSLRDDARYWSDWVHTSDGVSRLGLETSLETHFCEARSRRFQVSSRSRSRRFQISRLWILQRNDLLKFL